MHNVTETPQNTTLMPTEQRDVDTLYLTTLLDQLNQISYKLALEAAHSSAKTMLDQLRVRISRDVLGMGKQEAVTNG